MDNELNLEQYCGIWAIDEATFTAFLSTLRQMNLAAHVRGSSPKVAAVTSGPDSSGIKIIEISGIMTKQGSSLSDAGSTIRIKRAMRDARNDPKVKGVLLDIDSPGGTVSGTADLASEFSALSAEKPTVTFAEDMMASAALWVGSQGRRVFANASSAVIGGMGVFMGLYDLSLKAAKDGIRPVVIKTGELKGAGFPGVEIGKSQQEMYQGIVDAAFINFSGAVQKARRLSQNQVKEIAQGGVVPASKALSLGLLDGIRSMDGAIAELRALISSPPAAPVSGSNSVSPVTSKESTQVTISQSTELRQTALPATASWNARIEEAIAAGKSRHNAVSEIAEKNPSLHAAYLAEVNGRPAVSFAEVEPRPAIQAWQAAISNAQGTGLNRADAIRWVVKNRPELHKAYLQEVNAA